jgi:ankyrin repeat protein
MSYLSYKTQHLPSESEDTDIWFAAKNGNIRLLERCSEDNDYFEEYLNEVHLFEDDFYTPLQIAIAHHRIETASFLIEQGAELDCTLANGDTLLHMTVKYQMPRIAYELLELKENVDTANCLGQTPLYRAVWDGNIKFIKLFVKYRADPNAKAKNYSTPLSIAMGWENMDVVKCMQ